jgi:hypothetical protein
MRARSIFLVVAVVLAVYTGAAYAQQRSPVPQPALMECGTSGDVEIICGTHSPEDLEPAPDGRYVIISQMTGRDGVEGRIALFDPVNKTFTEMPIIVEPSRRDDSQMDRAENRDLEVSDKAEETRYPSGFICPFHFENPVSGRRTIVEGQRALSPDGH